MKINHKIDIFIESKKWLDKKTFMSKKSINHAIYRFSYKALEGGISRSKFKKSKKIKKFDSKINFILADDKLLKKLNTKFLKKRKTTNVLSFPNEDYKKNKTNFLGEVFIAYESCIKEAKKLNINNIDRIGHLIVHSTLHLLGFDHIRKKDEKKMIIIESKILDSLGINYY